MKKTILIVIMAFISIESIPMNKEVTIDTDAFERMQFEYETAQLKKMNSKQFDEFLYELGRRESSNNPDTVNTLGYIGEYQFGKAALKDVGYSHIKLSKFKEDPSIFPKQDQKKAVTKLIKLNFRRFERLANKYEGKYINGVKVTKSGLIGAAHIAGAGGVKRFLRTGGGYDPCDAYGTHLSDYLEEFAGHNFNLELV